MSQTRDPETTTPRVPGEGEAIVEQVRRRYARIADESTSCCGGGSPGPAELAAGEPAEAAGRIGYRREELDSVPAEANLGLGCGAPVDLLELVPGETVLDLGSGPGLDAMLAARRVGPEGRVIGIDMTPEMIARARDAARAAGLPQAEFRRGRLEELPVEDATADAVTSNCVINLVPDKARVFAEAARALRPGGRMVISDIVLDAPLPEPVAEDLLAWVGCLAGALPRDEYFAAVRQAGLGEIEVLRDVDALALLGGEVPAEVVGLLERNGTSVDELRGRVRSLTWRAVKPAAEPTPG